MVLSGRAQPFLDPLQLPAANKAFPYQRCYVFSGSNPEIIRGSQTEQRQSRDIFAIQRIYENSLFLEGSQTPHALAGELPAAAGS